MMYDSQPPKWYDWERKHSGEMTIDDWENKGSAHLGDRGEIWLRIVRHELFPLWQAVHWIYESARESAYGDGLDIYEESLYLFASMEEQRILYEMGIMTEDPYLYYYTDYFEEQYYEDGTPI